MRGSAGAMEDSSSSAEAPTASSKTGEAVANGSTGTNIQEAGVDEPDVAKTNGRIVVRLVENQRVVITDVTGVARARAGRLAAAVGSRTPTGLLLVGDHVLLAGDRGGVEPMLEEQRGDLTIAPTPRRHRAVRRRRLRPREPAPGQPHQLVRDGSSRCGSTTTRSAWSPRPVCPSCRSCSPAPGQRETEAEQRNREIVRNSTVQDWAPGLDCSDVFHPRDWSGSGDGVRGHVRVPARSTDATAGRGHRGRQRGLLLGGPALRDGHRLGWPGRDGPADDQPRTAHRSGEFRPTPPARTHIHAFALEGDSTRYLASGDIRGTIKDRWSLDERDGHLRVAVAWPDRDGQARENGVVVLDERGDRLETVGELRGLGVDEQIQSVRWFDDLAVVVTFRQTDPLYTIDLTDPTNPRRLGELKIPGFSAYLHPIGDDRLLGLGTDATPTVSPWVRRQPSSTSATGAGHVRSTRSPSATARSERARTHTRSPGCRRLVRRSRPCRLGDPGMDRA